MKTDETMSLYSFTYKDETHYVVIKDGMDIFAWAKKKFGPDAKVEDLRINRIASPDCAYRVYVVR